MSLFRTKRSAAVQPDFSGLALQTSTAAAAIPIIYGTTRCAPNIIWTAGASAVPQYSSSGGGGGKGGGGGGRTVSGYEYYEWVMFALGEGPLAAVTTIYSGQGTYAYGAFGLSLLPGTTPQAPWAPALSAYPANALPYNGTAYMASPTFDLGSSASVPTIAFEVVGRLRESANGPDVDPAAAILDLLTNPQYGVGFPAGSIDATTLNGTSLNGTSSSYAAYCRAAGLAFSPALTNPETAASILTRWLTLTNTAAIWSGGKLKFLPYGDAAIAGAQPRAATATIAAPFTLQPAPNGSFVADGGVTYATGGALAAVSGAPGKGQYGLAAGTYTFAAADAGSSVTVAFTVAPASPFSPNVTPVYDLSDDDLLASEGEDPIAVARSDPKSAANVVRLECLDRANAYAATPVEARDQNAIEMFGPNTASTITAHEICDINIGRTAAQLVLQRGLYIRNSYAFKLSWECGLLEPMDIVTLSDPGLGLSRTPVRIIDITEEADGLLAVTAEEFPAGTGSAAVNAVQPNAARPLNRNVAPAPVNPPLVFEPPPALSGDTPQVWAAVSGGSNGLADPNWGGATVWTSRDGGSYAPAGQVTAPARQGLLTAALPAPTGGNPDNAGILAVDLTMSAGVLASATASDAVNGVTLAIVDNELLAYAAASLTGPNRYALRGLQRGLYGSRAVAHAAGATFARLDAAVFKTALPASAIGTPLFLKFQSFNIFGGGTQDLATCAAISFTPVGSGLFGPTAGEIATGTSFDEGLASQPATQSDDYGLASDPYTSPLDDGLASDLPGAVAVAAGGTGATTAANARANIAAAASGANTDISSLTQLAAIGIGTAADTGTNLFACRSANALFDNGGAGIAVALNKATPAATAAHVFETGYAGRAQAGLLGSERYRIAVSSTGATYATALDIDPATGHVGLAGYTADANNALGVIGTACLFTAGIDSMRFTFNKVAAANDATLSFQTGFSARALLGTAGSDAFQLKVSPDGGTFFQSFVVDPGTGNAAFKALLGLLLATVAALPAAAFNGALAFASNGRKLGEAAGGGSGVVVAYSSGAWRRLSDDSVVVS